MLSRRRWTPTMSASAGSEPGEMTQDTDPPTFDFGSPRRERGPAADPIPALDPGAEPEGQESDQDEPSSPEEPPRGPRFQLFRSETARRVLWALPWIVFAVFIVAVG